MRRRRRRCIICRELFLADARVGQRQCACSKPECQRERRRQTQASWRARNPDYFMDRRLRQRALAARAAAEEAPAAALAWRVGQRPLGPTVSRPPPLAVPAAMRSIPWSLAQDEIGVQATDFLAVTARLVLRVAQDQR